MSPDLQRLTNPAVARLNAAIEKYCPKLVIGLNSGGHDSGSACKVASLASQFDGCLHVNTGIGIEATRQYVRDTCAAHGWKLWEYKASENTKADGTPDAMDYDVIALKFGFPGPAAHRFMYIKLKQRCIERFLRDMGATPSERVMFVSGARTQESERRMGNTDIEPSERGASVWVNPIHDWTKADTSACLSLSGIQRNLVVDLIHKSGECLCGAFAKKGELAELAVWDITRPSYEHIRDLERRVKEAGFPWGWEDDVPEWWAEKNAGQLFMLDYDDPDGWDMPLCLSCPKTAEKPAA